LSPELILLMLFLWSVKTCNTQLIKIGVFRYLKETCDLEITYQKCQYILGGGIYWLWLGATHWKQKNISRFS
jgi:hypothetical protein